MSYIFTKKEHKLNFITGKYTCASSKGNFCRFFRVRNLGTIPCCSLYDMDLTQDEKGVTLRCKDCLDEFPN